MPRRHSRRIAALADHGRFWRKIPAGRIHIRVSRLRPPVARMIRKSVKRFSENLPRSAERSREPVRQGLESRTVS